MSWDLLIQKGQAWVSGPQGIRPQQVDIAIANGTIAELGVGLDKDKAKKVISAQNLQVLPGVIDSQVHFREPGNPHKEDLATGTMSAILGGVTAVFEMPNTKPSTISAIELADKVSRAQGRAWCDIGFFMGATPANLSRLGDLEKLPGVVGVKVFMGTSTGDLLLKSDEDLQTLFRHVHRRVAIHCEDEFLLNENEARLGPLNNVLQHPQWRSVETALKATQRAIKWASQANKPVHILHVTTADEMEFLAQHKNVATVETTPQHLLLSSPECYERLGSLVQMNPPIREKRHQEGLWKAVLSGVVDVIGTDHAPHTLEEKARPYPQSPSGLPGVQTLVPLLLNCVNEERLSMQRLVELICERPAELYNAKNIGKIAKGYRANFTLVDLGKVETISNSKIASKCGWSPFDGTKVKGWPVATIVGGHIVMRDGEVLGKPEGQICEFA